MVAGVCKDTQDVKVTDDDEDKEDWSGDDEAHKGNKIQCVCVCVCYAKLEVIRICGGPLLGFFGHESSFTRLVLTQSRCTIMSTWDLVTPLNRTRVREEMR